MNALALVACLLMPWGGQAGSHSITNTSDAAATVHWVYWNAIGDKVADVTTHLEPGAVGVQDVHGVAHDSDGEEVDLAYSEPAHGTMYVSSTASIGGTWRMGQLSGEATPYAPTHGRCILPEEILDMVGFD
jgi:hypothetical protein